jgi:hypothetical protein
MSGNVTYLFYAVENPLSQAERMQIQDLSRRVDPTTRRADFWYDVDGYDLPVPYEALLARYYDVMVRQDYEQWTLAIVVPYSPVLHQALKRYECEDGEGCGVRVEAMDAKYSPHGKRRVTKPTRLLAEITTFFDYDVVESLEGLRGWKWERDVKDEEEADEDWDEEEWGEEYVNEDAMDETLALLTNSLRQDVLQGDLSVFYIGWQKFHDPDSKLHSPTPPPHKSRTSPYLKAFKRMLLKSGER